jgi:hypothetical protein
MSEHFTIVELSGHIIDTLTLAKVIQAFQRAGVSYQVNDFQIGPHKTDTSSMQISIWADSGTALQDLLDNLRPMGAVPVENRPVKTMSCAQDSVLPPGAYLRWNPPTQVLMQGDWVDVDRNGSDLTIVVDPATGRASMCKVSEVKKGDRVVIGKSGVKVLPTLAT